MRNETTETRKRKDADNANLLCTNQVQTNK